MQNLTLIKNIQEDPEFNNHLKKNTYTTPFNTSPVNTTPINENNIIYNHQPQSQPQLQDKLNFIPSYRDSDMTNYVAMAYQIASNLRNNDPYAYKQCSRFYKNDNTAYIIVIVFLLLVCVFLSRTRN